MQIFYDNVIDLLYLRFDDRIQEVINKRIAEDVVLDIGEDDKLIGIEFLNASRQLNLEKLLPVEHGAPA